VSKQDGHYSKFGFLVPVHKMSLERKRLTLDVVFTGTMEMKLE